MTTQLALDFGIPCAACGSYCGRQVEIVAAKPGEIVVVHVGDSSPYDPPRPGETHPADLVDPTAERWPCPHCGVGPYEHRDSCAENDLHPHDCRCRWCTYGVVWEECPRCGRGGHTAGPARPDVVECRAHGPQRLDSRAVALRRDRAGAVPSPAADAAAAARLRAVPPPSEAVGIA